MSQINVNRIKDSNEGAPDFPSGVNVSGITSTVTLGVTNLNTTNLNVSGVVTATTFDGALPTTGTPTLGLGVTINTSGLNISGVATAGIVSATTLFGDGTNITGIALTIAPLNYNPALNGINVSKSPGIGFTFNQAVKAGSGNVTLRKTNGSGTVVQNWGVGSSITYSGDEITMSLDSELDIDATYHLSYPSGAFTTIGGDVSYVGTAYTFAIETGIAQLWGFGNGTGGMLGQNNGVSYSSPVQLPASDPLWDKIGYANNIAEYTLGRKTDGTLWVWGMNEFGVLNANLAHDVHRSSPIQIPGTNWSKALGGSQTSPKAVKTDGTLWTWGQNHGGNLGQNQGPGQLTATSSPVQIPGTTWETGEDKVKRNGTYGSGWLKTDGTLWCWGLDIQGSLGQNSHVDYSSPVQVPGTNWNLLSQGRSTTAAIKTDGTLWVWGRGDFGGLAQNSEVDYSSPVQVPGTNWRTISAAYGMLATKTDGTLWAWGRNAYSGRLGQNSEVNYSSPIQIPGTNWDKAEFGFANLATKTDGTLWSWGYNLYGAMGINSRVNHSSPVQIPGFSNPVSFATGRRNWVIKLG